MSLLNQNVQFADLPGNIRNAFSGGMGTKIQLPAGTSLYRFSGHTHISPWWTETTELTGLILGAKSSGQSLFNYIRTSSAVLRQWDSNMYHLIIAQLTTPVWAFKGLISPQNEASKYMDVNDVNFKKKFTKPVFMGGGNGQVYIKDIAAHHLNIIVPAGAVNIYDKIDDILDFLVSYKLV
jgi:hypothetical protein